MKTLLTLALVATLTSAPLQAAGTLTKDEFQLCSDVAALAETIENRMLRGDSKREVYSTHMNTPDVSPRAQALANAVADAVYNGVPPGVIFDNCVERKRAN